MNTDFPHLPILQHLRPAPGWRTDRALISTYSAQMPVVAAILLALAGEADDAGVGTRVGLVRALTGLRGKVHVILQSGRLQQGRRDTAIFGLFDQFLLQVPWDESAGPAGKSWHAKFALVRQTPVESEQAGARWVFLLGSRNLTSDTSWDIGLVLEGSEAADGGCNREQQPIDGIADLVRASVKLLATPALKPWQGVGKRLRGVSWRVPKGLRISDLRLMLPDDDGRALPSPPPGLREWVAVSPFLDKNAVRHLLRWPLVKAGDGRRKLLSTRTALASVFGGAKLAVAPELLVLAESNFDESIKIDAAADDELAPEHIGLHAKIIHAVHAAGTTMWFGSPNLTHRAWSRNAEIIVRVDSTNKHGSEILNGGLQDLLERANKVREEDLEELAKEPTAEHLAAARNHVAARLGAAHQRRDAKGRVWIECREPPHPKKARITLRCGQISGAMTVWPVGSRMMSFPLLATAVESNCIRCQLELEDQVVHWVQVVLFPALNLEERDARVLSEYLGARGMLDWIHSVLNGYSGGGEGGAWCEPRKLDHGHGQKVTGLDLPTLEQVLRMWLRDRSQVDEVGRILSLKRDDAAGSNVNADDAAKKELEIFASNWAVIRDGLRGAT